VIQQKLLFTKQDELGLVLVGTDDTDNALAAEDPGSYEHVTVLQQLQKPDLKMLETIKSATAAAAAAAAHSGGRAAALETEGDSTAH